MGDLSDQVKENMRRLSDEALAKIIESDRANYTEEAVAYARVELERRRVIEGLGSAGTSGPAVTPAPGIASVPSGASATAEPPVPITKRSRFWGRVLLIVGVLFVYGAVLLGTTLIVGAQEGRHLNSDAYFSILIYVVIAAVCLTAGIKRVSRWETYLGVAFSVFGVLAFFARMNISRTSYSILVKATLYTAFILILLGAAFFLMGLVKRKTA